MSKDKDNGLNGSENIIDLAGARKQQRTVAKEKAKRAGGSSGRSGSVNSTGSSQGKGFKGGKLKIWQWVQFIGFLLVISYLMTLCSG